MFQNTVGTLSACNATTLLPTAKSSIFDFTYGVIMTSYEGGLAPNLHTSYVIRFSCRCVRNFAFQRLCVMETMSEKESGNFMWRLKGGAGPPVPEHGTVRLLWCQIHFQHPKLPYRTGTFIFELHTTSYKGGVKC